MIRAAIIAAAVFGTLALGRLVQPAAHPPIVIHGTHSLDRKAGPLPTLPTQKP